MWHTFCTHITCVSFSHNLCCKYLNGSCEPILNIYVSRNFKRYKEIFNSMSFDPPKSLFKNLGVLWNSNSQNGNPLGSVWAHFFTFFHTLESANVIPKLHFGLHLSMPFALVTSLKLRSWQYPSKFQKICYGINVFMRPTRSHKYYWSTLRGVLHVYWIVLGMNNTPSIMSIPK
jgi:hypothetical protein